MQDSKASSSAGAREAAERFRVAMMSGDSAAVASVLAEDVLFYSPASNEPTAGRENVARVLATARQVYGEMRFGETLADGPTAVLFFEAEVSGHHLQACYRVAVSSELVHRLDALMRPVEATRALVAEMMRRTAAGRQA